MFEDAHLADEDDGERIARIIRGLCPGRVMPVTYRPEEFAVPGLVFGRRFDYPPRTTVLRHKTGPLALATVRRVMQKTELVPAARGPTGLEWFRQALAAVEAGHARGMQSRGVQVGRGGEALVVAEVEDGSSPQMAIGVKAGPIEVGRVVAGLVVEDAMQGRTRTPRSVARCWVAPLWV
ncbi:hypothetical protein [Streptomyces zagrosensis]|uniref:Uncharacterized protein n=1 Tax=Streptomyces zagrosensis TaxID=1042984 RepID=A0A7W9V0T9_9ACTN|nr:hypothetical protein [Streptomyces zagrosensis]MBB5938583.1 hypothetical protein [Streptomyces zagrosensis]